ncbi:dienelactone hydrolase family protein [Bradyrhizobium sp. AUGA SZCCT0042]|uniref:dienelactone hydrolase family protein n=1 Tax=Bradyrhizobium sp. AUGA SZCCT0042 TaxID=2807651 RepID=UPI001BA5400F|nr:alpha/beta hydrolase [Bradyrhizobium sp. AUGA SZCCT0042]MBR1298080.1 alpha/beta hydrolase [Bradyrhizobium sp. AUGA SZCCT0042]
MRNLLMILVAVLMNGMHGAQAQSLTVDPESIVPLPDKFDMETPAPDVPPEIARFQGAWIGTWHDDRHILVVERVKPDGHAKVVFAQSDSAFYGMNREWWRDEATIVDGVLTMTGFRTFRYAFDGSDRLYMTATLKSGGVTSGAMVRTDAARLAAGQRPVDWPWPGERVRSPHLIVRTPDGARPIMLEATFYPPTGPGPAPLAIFTHGSDVGRNQLRTWSFSTEAHWLRDNGFAVLALMRRGRGRSEGINGEEDFGRANDGSLVDVSAGVAQAVEDLESAIAYGRTLPGVRPGPVLVAGQSRGGFLAMRYAGLKPGEVMAVVNFTGGWYPYGPVTTPYYAKAGRGAAEKVPQLWLYADSDKLYPEALIREYYQAFTAAGGRARFELLHDVPGDGHLLRLYPSRWRPIADEFLASLSRQRP